MAEKPTGDLWEGYEQDSRETSPLVLFPLIAKKDGLNFTSEFCLRFPYL
jgi:hypothetical protein